MQNSLFCTGYSTIIRESRDASCASSTPPVACFPSSPCFPCISGRSLPVSKAPASSTASTRCTTDDAFVVNHPYYGGSPHAHGHGGALTDHARRQVFGFSGSIAHKSDIGGLVPGTNSGQAREIFHEGLMVPPVRLV